MLAIRVRRLISRLTRSAKLDVLNRRRCAGLSWKAQNNSVRSFPLETGTPSQSLRFSRNKFDQNAQRGDVAIPLIP